MQHRARALTFMLALFWLSGPAEADPIEHIRAYYTHLTTEIARCDTARQRATLADADDCALYLVEITENALHRPVAGVGIAERRLRYWYDPSGFSGDAAEASGAGPGALARVEIRAQRAALSWFEEYVYEQGKLVFYFKTSDLGAFRFYFQNERLVKFVASDLAEAVDEAGERMRESDWAEVLQAARRVRVSGSGVEHDRAAVMRDPVAVRCPASTRSRPTEMRIREADLSNEEALAGLFFIESQILEPLANTNAAPEMSWEMLHLAMPNALRAIRGALLKARALSLMEARRHQPDAVSAQAIDEAVDAYCRVLIESARND